MSSILSAASAADGAGGWRELAARAPVGTTGSYADQMVARFDAEKKPTVTLLVWWVLPPTLAVPPDRLCYVQGGFNAEQVCARVREVPPSP